MDANQNPPSEREWTAEEMKEFYGGTASNGVWMSSIQEFSIDDIKRLLPYPNIHVTKITPPEAGWPIAAHCPICKETTFVWNAYAIKPEKGDYWLMKDTCLSNERHRMTLALPKIEFKPLDPPCPWPLPSFIEWTRYIPIEEAKQRWPETPLEEEDK